MAENIEVTVQIGGVDVVAGTLFTRASRGIESSTFRYTSEYVRSPEAYELDPGMPLSESPSHTPAGKALFNAFADSAPDRWGRMLMKRAERDRAEETGAAPRQLIELDYLLGASDVQRQGAPAPAEYAPSTANWSQSGRGMRWSFRDSTAAATTESATSAPSPP
ncbi:MAG: HipA protein [Subtercola sp.]|nr:HipA protein [Subtercola sp.]